MIYAFISAEKANFPVSFMCKQLGVPTTSYYDWCNNAQLRAEKQRQEAELVVVIKGVHKESEGTYGQPRMTPALRDLGYCLNHKKVERLMAKHQIIGYRPKKRIITTIRASDAENIIDLLKRDFRKPDRDIAWCGDISYIRTHEGWLYLATVIDLGSRRVIGYAMADHMRTELVEDALRMAVKTRGRTKMNNIVFHTDKGSQYTSEDFAKTAETLGIIRSVGRTGICFDNAVAESFFASLKKELVYRKTFKTREQARKEIFNYIETWFNSRRLHSTLGYMSPIAWEQAQTASTTVTSNAA